MVQQKQQNQKPLQQQKRPVQKQSQNTTKQIKESEKKSKKKPITNSYEFGNLNAPPTEEYTVYEKKDFTKELPTISSDVPKKRKSTPELGRLNKYPPITNIEQYLSLEKVYFEQRFKEKLSSIDSKQFEYIRFLGKGGYGIVSMVRDTESGLWYASKEMSKHNIMMNKKVDEVKNEKLILQSIRFPFTVHLKFFYQDRSKIYFVLPLMIGGDLYGYIKTLGKFSENLCKFLMSQVLLAVEYLHFLGLVHRDIKLENILIDHVGYIKLGDFGMCKWLKQGRSYTICGTAEYLAPEMLNHKGYGLAVDWWAFGVLTYELCSGKTPFVSEEYLEIFHLITQNQYTIPLYFSYTLTDLITHLLEPDLSKRYGNLKDGVNDIKRHDFFKNIHWIDLINRRIDSPFLSYMVKPKDEFFEPEEPPPDKEDITKDFGGPFTDF